MAAQFTDEQLLPNVVQTFVSNTSYQQPALAARWVEKLPAPNQRNNMIESITRYWFPNDPKAAEKWLESTSLPEDRKQGMRDWFKTNR